MFVKTECKLFVKQMQVESKQIPFSIKKIGNFKPPGVELNADNNLVLRWLPDLHHVILFENSFNFTCKNNKISVNFAETSDDLQMLILPFDLVTATLKEC